MPEGEEVAIVRAYMAHHQGMSLAALANVLLGGVMLDRFHAEPIVQATELLLQERTPRDVLVARPRAEEVSAAAQVRDMLPPVVRRFSSPYDATPRTQLLSNGRYAVMLTAAGSGYSRMAQYCSHHAMAGRPHAGIAGEPTSSFAMSRPGTSGRPVTSPPALNPDSYEAAFYEDHAEFVRRESLIARHHDSKLSFPPRMTRKSGAFRLQILGARARQIQVTSYAEISLTSQATDLAHPAFSNLFVETELVPDMGAILATRRKRSPDDAGRLRRTPAFCRGRSHWRSAGHTRPIEPDSSDRGRDLRNPISIIDGRPLSGTVGSVLDPVMSLRRTVRIHSRNHRSFYVYYHCGF